MHTFIVSENRQACIIKTLMAHRGHILEQVEAAWGTNRRSTMYIFDAVS